MCAEVFEGRNLNAGDSFIHTACVIRTHAHMHSDTNIYALNCAHSWKIGNSICACMSTMCIYKSSYAIVLSGNAVCAGWFTHVIATWALIPCI